ncbi:hypothetical protein M472_15035 [Sphingobacterium paucimobilis HER1398]|uniref:Uncharacterized protein n=2 Tax=Sphingobacterium TaxID=28453 RepID=U2HX35_9SPHI|nr:hypothetical protein M472_15035 [Sphingobacterium paucimobilis HER1398]
MEKNFRQVGHLFTIAMRYLITFLISISAVAFSYAQDDLALYEPTKADYDYWEYRRKMTVPPYGLDKVKGLIKKIEIKSDDNDDMGLSALSTADFKSLTLREKFTYTVVHPELYSQNCDIRIMLPNEEQKVFGYLLSTLNEQTWSQRQLVFLRENRDSVMSYIEESTLRSKRMGVNYKDVIDEINGWEMIPFIITYFESNKKDKDALTLLLLLMKKGEYEEFLKSTSYRKLYGQSYNYETYIEYNKANEALILQRAMGYFKEKSAGGK